MDTKIATAIADGDASSASTRIIEALRAQLEGREAALVMAFASTSQPLDLVLGELSRAFPSATVLGASTAGEFNETKVARGSTSAIAIAGDLEAHAGIGRSLASDPERAVAQAVQMLPRDVPGRPHRTAILLLDPLAGVSEEATLMAATALAVHAAIPLAGGAAGDDLAMKCTFVGCGAETHSDAVVVATIHSTRPLGIGVAHGHRPVSGPLEITRAEGNVVYEIEGRPAWDVWREQTRAAATSHGIDPDGLSEAEIGGFLLRYEAGLASGDAFKIRAPLSRGEGGSLSFACGIPTGAVIRITESEAARQVEAARRAARSARAALGDAEPAGAIVFDCICRNLILGEAFDDAVRGMSEELGGAPLAGFETYGEIALDVGDMSGFHNTTSVVLAFPR